MDGIQRQPTTKPKVAAVVSKPTAIEVRAAARAEKRRELQERYEQKGREEEEVSWVCRVVPVPVWITIDPLLT